MLSHQTFGWLLAGGCAGLISGIFGGGGGMVLIPLLVLLTDIGEREVFGASVAIILPVCLVSLAATAFTTSIPWQASLPYLIGSAIGGYGAVRFGRLIPSKWLHRILGTLIIWGGIRYLC